MDRPLSILLVEDDPRDCQEIVGYIESVSNIRLAGVTNNTAQALEYVTDMHPDAIILDLELHKGLGDGLAFLESLKEIRRNLPIYVLVTTNNISQITHSSARMLGADFIMIKSQKDYSAKTAIDFLSSLKDIIQSNRKTVVGTENADTPQQRKQRIMNRIIKEIDRLGVPHNAMGRKYLIDGIEMIIEGQAGKLYTTISAKHGKTYASVERAMLHAIERTWKSADSSDLEQYYTARINSVRGVPTTTEFVFYYANKIKNDF